MVIYHCRRHALRTTKLDNQARSGHHSAEGELLFHQWSHLRVQGLPLLHNVAPGLLEFLAGGRILCRDCVSAFRSYVNAYASTLTPSGFGVWLCLHFVKEWPEIPRAYRSQPQTRARPRACSALTREIKTKAHRKTKENAQREGGTSATPLATCHALPPAAPTAIAAPAGLLLTVTVLINLHGKALASCPSPSEAGTPAPESRAASLEPRRALLCPPRRLASGAHGLPLQQYSGGLPCRQGARAPPGAAEE